MILTLDVVDVVVIDRFASFQKTGKSRFLLIQRVPSTSYI